MDGILIIDKPAEWTSHDVIGKIRRIFRTRRVGHTGTLDPFATGVLVVLVGQATRLAPFLEKDVKEYLAEIRFGFETTTADLTGEIIENEFCRPSENSFVSKAVFEKTLESFQGVYEQTPPMFSAKKIDGKKLYELARKGLEVERKSVAVNIYEIENAAENLLETSDRFSFRVKCSAGTYVRTLAQDIGRKIGTGAHLTNLRRVSAGKFNVSQAVTLENLAKSVEENLCGAHLIPMFSALSHLPLIKLNEERVLKTRQGMSSRLFDEPAGVEDGAFVRICGNSLELIAVGIFDKAERSIQPKIVFQES